jgi:3-deoxy-D-manno-octulosonic-acid transferase
LLLYRFVLLLLRLGLLVAGLFGVRKARKAIQGRRGWSKRWASADVKARQNGRKGSWIHLHCASLGEFEQGAEVMAALRRHQPQRPILLTFFSPSGVEGAFAPEADHVDYLPFDSGPAMRRFASTVEIGDSILVKYELWPGLIQALHRSGTRVHLVAARFDHGKHPLNASGFLVRSAMRQLTTLQTQDIASRDVLSDWGFDSLMTGDPRVDRVQQTRRIEPPGEVATALTAMQEWANGRRVIVVGSAWPPEWECLQAILDGHPEWCAWVAPHEVDAAHARQWGRTEGTTTLTALENPEIAAPAGKVLIMDRIGILKFAYRRGQFAIVGGGWGKGVHNTLEPAAFGLPVLFGPAIGGFREIDALMEVGAARMCANRGELTAHARHWMEDDVKLQHSGNAARTWVDEQSGAAERIVKEVLRHIQ